MDKYLVSKEENKYSKKHTAIFVIVCSMIGGLLGVELVRSFLECVSTIINKFNIAMEFDFYGIHVDTFFREVNISQDAWLLLLISSTFIFLSIFTTIAIRDWSK